MCFTICYVVFFSSLSVFIIRERDVSMTRYDYFLAGVIWLSAMGMGASIIAAMWKWLV